MAMKKEHFMSSFINLGKHQINDMDVYLETLLEKMLLIWNEVQMYDIS
jgi:hypothetical protein